VNRNYPDDLRVGYKSSFNLIKLIGIYGDLEEQLKQFEKSFEKDEIMDI
jgi:hypothetical protein